VAPFSPAQETDSAWGIATWLVPEFVAEYYDDERVIHQMYECARWFMEHWIAVANSTGGWYSYDKYSDFGNTNTPAAEYVTGASNTSLKRVIISFLQILSLTNCVPNRQDAVLLHHCPAAHGTTDCNIVPS
jgi:hypothetical protein